MRSKQIYFSQKRSIHSSITIPQWLYNVSLIAIGGDETELKKSIKKLAIQGNVLEVDNVSFFVQQQLLIAVIEQATDVVMGRVETSDLVRDTLASFLDCFSSDAQDKAA